MNDEIKPQNPYHLEHCPWMNNHQGETSRIFAEIDARRAKARELGQTCGTCGNMGAETNADSMFPPCFFCQGNDHWVPKPAVPPPKDQDGQGN